MNIDVDRIADLLFGSEAGKEFSTRKAVSLILCAVASFKKTNNLGGEATDLELNRSFSAPFASRYLDRFMDFLQPKLQRTFDVEFEMILAGMVLDTPYFDKWVREVPSQKLESFFRRFIMLSLEPGMSPEINRVFSHFVQSDRSAPVPTDLLDHVKMIASLYNIPCDILLQLPRPPPLHDFTTPPVKVPQPESYQVAARLLPFWNAVERLSQMEPVGRPFGDFLVELKARARGVEPFRAFLNDPKSWKENKSQFATHGRKGFISWLSCEAKDGVESACTVLETGEEMRACGKCQVVRYCSEEHQRAHWKKHKKTCFVVE